MVAVQVDGDVDVDYVAVLEGPGGGGGADRFCELGWWRAVFQSETRAELLLPDPRHPSAARTPRPTTPLKPPRTSRPGSRGTGTR